MPDRKKGPPPSRQLLCQQVCERLSEVFAWMLKHGKAAKSSFLQELLELITMIEEWSVERRDALRC